MFENYLIWINSEVFAGGTQRPIFTEKHIPPLWWCHADSFGFIWLGKLWRSFSQQLFELVQTEITVWTAMKLGTDIQEDEPLHQQFDLSNQVLLHLKDWHNFFYRHWWIPDDELSSDSFSTATMRFTYSRMDWNEIWYRYLLYVPFNMKFNPITIYLAPSLFFFSVFLIKWFIQL